MIGGTFFDEPLRWLHNYYLYRSTGLHWIDLPVDDVTVSVDEGTGKSVFIGRDNQGLEWASPPQWWMGHSLDLAVRPNKVRNVCGVGIGARQGGYSNHAVYKAEELSMRKLKLWVRIAYVLQGGGAAIVDSKCLVFYRGQTSNSTKSQNTTNPVYDNKKYQVQEE